MQVVLSTNLGDIALEQEVYPEALIHYLDALAVAKEQDIRPFLADLTWGLGRTHLALGNYANAQSFLRQHLEASAQNQDHSVALGNLLALAEVRARQGQPEQACEWLALVVDDPATKTEDRDRARQLLGELRNMVPSGTLNEPQRLSKESNLDAVVEKILGDLPAPDIRW